MSTPGPFGPPAIAPHPGAQGLPLAPSQEPARVLILGAGLAGWSVARELRQRSPDASITLVCADAGHFYSKPNLSNALALGKSGDALIQTRAESQAARLAVHLLAHRRVLSIDRERQVVQSDHGEALPYDQLVLALGADPIRLPLTGVELTHSVNDLASYQAFASGLQRPARVAILGAGLIGCEFANDLAAQGHAVDVIDPGERPVAALLDTGASHRLQTALEALGVRFHWGDLAQAVERGDDALTLALRSGARLNVDRVLSAVGLRARTALADQAGLVVQRGVVVDRFGRTSDPAIWALGDCAAYDPASLAHAPASTEPRPLPFVLPLMAAAKAIASNLAAPTKPLTPMAFGAMTVRIKTPACPLAVAV